MCDICEKIKNFTIEECDEKIENFKKVQLEVRKDIKEVNNELNAIYKSYAMVVTLEATLSVIRDNPSQVLAIKLAELIKSEVDQAIKNWKGFKHAEN